MSKFKKLANLLALKRTSVSKEKKTDQNKFVDCL